MAGGIIDIFGSRRCGGKAEPRDWGYVSRELWVLHGAMKVWDRMEQ